MTSRSRGRDDIVACDRLIGTLENFFPGAMVEGYEELAPGRVVRLLRKRVAEHRRPPKHIQGLLDMLDRSGVPDFAAEVRRRLDWAS